MRFVFLPSAEAGLDWYRHYYGHVFPEGKKAAREQYFKMKRVLRAAPLVGKPIGETDAREYPMPRTSFTIVYRVKEDIIEVQLVLDQRAERPDMS
jgi:hypothetical protein